MTRPTNEGARRPSIYGLGVTPGPGSDIVTYPGHEGADVEAALDARPPTHLSASTDPAVADDTGDGHVEGCRWINLASGEEFVAVDVSLGAAVWTSTTAGGGGGLTDHTHAVTGSGATGGGDTLSPVTLNLPTNATPSQTADGRIVWDSDDNVITVGDGAATKQFGYLGSTTPSVESGSGSAGSSKETARADHVHPADGGGGGGTVFDGKPYIWTPPSSAATEDDEFNDGTGMSGPSNGLNAKWSKHNLGTSSWLKLSDTIAPGSLLFDIPTGQSQDQSIYQTVPAGDFTLACRFTVGGVGDRQMWAMYIVNSSGTGISICFDLNDSQAHGVRTMTTWAAAGTLTTAWSGGQASNFNATFGLGVTMFLRKASGVYHGGFSYSDRARSPDAIFEVNQTPSSFTPAYIGFGRVFGTDKSRVMLDLFRKIA